jgi:ferrous iron transport protein B
MLKKTKTFAGDVAPFVMELPSYHLPTFKNLMLSMWERGFSFIKKAGSVILLSTVIIWLGSSFGVVDGSFVFSLDMELRDSVLGFFGKAFGWIFAPLGFSGIETTVATFMGLVAKEEIVAVLGVLDFAQMGKLAAFSFLVFNLLCAPCFAAMAAIRREMNSGRWTAFAIGYQCVFAYLASFCIFNIGSFFTGAFYWWEALTFALSLAVIGFVVYMLVRPAKKKSINNANL